MNVIVGSFDNTKIPVRLHAIVSLQFLVYLTLQNH